MGRFDREPQQQSTEILKANLNTKKIIIVHGGRCFKCRIFMSSFALLLARNILLKYTI